MQLIFPASLTARQRAAVHAIGERHGLPHSSQGEGAERHIVLGPSGAPAVVLGEPAGDGAASVQPALSDDQLAALIKQHLQLEVAEEFASKPGSSNGGGDGARRPPVGGGPWRRAEAAAAAKPGSRGLVTPEEFIARVLPLLDMEREAEVAQVPWEGPQPLRVHLACLHQSQNGFQICAKSLFCCLHGAAPALLAVSTAAVPRREQGARSAWLTSAALWCSHLTRLENR